MATNARRGPAPALVRAARDGDPQALSALVAETLPLVYNLAGRALHRQADLDDVVQGTMLRVLDGLGGLEDPAGYRSWVVSVTLNQVREHARRHGEAEARGSMYAQAPAYADLGSDFVGITVLRLGLTEQRGDVAEATRWLDAEDRELLSLWWLEEAGYLDRHDLAGALDLSPRHAAVRVHRMKRQLDTARSIVYALRDASRCRSLRSVAQEWDGAPSPLWRKRFDRHVRNCTVCEPQDRVLIPVSRLLRGLPLVPVPEAWRTTAFGSGDAGYPGGSGYDASNLEATTHIPRVLDPIASHSHRADDPPRRRRSPIFITGVAIAAVAVAAFVVIPGQRPATVPFADGTEPVPAAALPSNSASARASLSASPSKSQSRSASASPSRTPSRKATTPAAPSTRTPSSSAPTAGDNAVAPVAPAQTSSRKGVGAWTFSGDNQALAESGASWFYTWSSSSEGLSAPGAGFVPMVWGSGSVTSSTLTQAKDSTSCGCMLGFNEPDNSGQSNMTPAQALALWPQLMSTGLQLGSPAVASGGATAGGWLDQFMTGAQQAGYRVNFITLHWYGSDFNTTDAVSQLQSYIEAVYNRYHLPIWLTEFALISFANGGSTYPSETQQAAFLTAATAMLDSLPYVQRYAWFGLGATTLPSTGLFQAGPVVTPVGTAFEAAQ
jgi:RNA polymerase sigma factor (sigma-70 family)